MNFDVIIAGGGAAGLYCAIEAGRRGRKVLLVEHNDQVGRKILISGGGRCNFTNLNTTPENFISENPHFCKSALARFSPRDFVALVEKHRIDWYEKKLGQLFCRSSSRQIVEMLLDECRKANVSIRLGCSVRMISKGSEPDGKFEVDTNQGKLTSEKLVIATGGLSIPKLGATGFGYSVARQFGLKIVETRAALVPFIFDPDFPASYRSLAGVSFDAAVSCGNKTFRENVLFTHKGLSGPAILQASSYWKRGGQISIDLLPSADKLGVLLRAHNSRKNPAKFLSEFLPARFAEVWARENSFTKPLASIGERELAVVAEKLENWKIAFIATEGYGKAEVTAGGVSTDELSSKTMESKRVKGLCFIGEVVDVTGWLGGYNFQWAWASAHASGQFI